VVVRVCACVRDNRIEILTHQLGGGGRVRAPPQTQCHAPITLLDEDIWALLKVNFGTMGADRPEFHKISGQTRPENFLGSGGEGW
jgi:hypothetical protein